MTTKQKQNIARFKKVQAEAKKLRSKNKKLTQAEAVKQAWAIQYSKEGKTKKVGYSSDRLAVVKKATKGIKKYIDKGYSRRDAIRNANIDAAYSSNLSGVKTKVKAKRGRSAEMHTDTKSHNVNIRVISGMSAGAKKMLDTWSAVYSRLATDLILSKNVKEKNIIRKEMKIAKEIIDKLKKIK